jgi:hypothetical protein
MIEIHLVIRQCIDCRKAMATRFSITAGINLLVFVDAGSSFNVITLVRLKLIISFRISKSRLLIFCFQFLFDDAHSARRILIPLMLYLQIIAQSVRLNLQVLEIKFLSHAKKRYQ